MTALGFAAGFLFGGVATAGAIGLWWAIPIGSSLEVTGREEGVDRD